MAKGGEEQTQEGQGLVIARARQARSSHWPGTHTGARCVPFLFNLRIENLTRVRPGLSLAFPHSLDKCRLG